MAQSFYWLRDVENYIYFHHLDLCIALPTYADSINDNQSVTFSQNNPMGRSAPLYSYSYSGPRSIMFDFRLHRDEMTAIAYNKSRYGNLPDYDIVEAFIKQMRAAALPVYAASAKMVNPPIVSVKCSSDIFITGIVSGNVNVSYDLPIIQYNGEDKYAKVGVSFTLCEIDPYDAEEVITVGGYRGVPTSLSRNTYVIGNGGAGGGSPTKNLVQLTDNSSGIWR